jgi:hypothetical protein
MLATRSKPRKVTQKQSSFFAVLRPTSINLENSLRKDRNPQADDNFIFIPLILILRLLTTKLCGANEAQRSLRPNERLVM